MPAATAATQRPPCDRCGGLREPGVRFCTRCKLWAVDQMKRSGYLQELPRPTPMPASEGDR